VCGKRFGHKTSPRWRGKIGFCGPFPHRVIDHLVEFARGCKNLESAAYVRTPCDRLITLPILSSRWLGWYLLTVTNTAVRCISGKMVWGTWTSGWWSLRSCAARRWTDYQRGMRFVGLYFILLSTPGQELVETFVRTCIIRCLVRPPLEENFWWQRLHSNVLSILNGLNCGLFFCRFADAWGIDRIFPSKWPNMSCGNDGYIYTMEDNRRYVIGVSIVCIRVVIGISIFPLSRIHFEFTIWILSFVNFISGHAFYRHPLPNFDRLFHKGQIRTKRKIGANECGTPFDSQCQVT